MLDLLVQGDVVLPDSVLRNGAVGIAVGRVAGIYASPAVAPAARETVDAAGCLVYPGMVDAHVHCHSNPAENFESATQAAAAGGVTTIVEMPYDEGAPVNSPAVFRVKVEAIPTTCRVDVALLATLRKRATSAEVAPLVREGACGFRRSQRGIPASPARTGRRGSPPRGRSCREAPGASSAGSAPARRASPPPRRGRSPPS